MPHALFAEFRLNYNSDKVEAFTELRINRELLARISTRVPRELSVTEVWSIAKVIREYHTRARVRDHGRARDG